MKNSFFAKQRRHILIALLLAALLVSMLYFVSPVHFVIKLEFTLLFGCLIYVVINMFVGRQLSALVAAGMAVLLLLQVTALLSIFHASLLLAILESLYVLTKRS